VRLIIDEEFHSLIPPLTLEEYQQLEANILADGIREPIITWWDTNELHRAKCDCGSPMKFNDLETAETIGVYCPACENAETVTKTYVIIDGHNRYKIAQEHGLEYQTDEKDFDSRAQAMDWMICNQLGRRNLNQLQQSYLRGKQKERETQKQAFKGNQYTKSGLPQNEGNQETAERLALQHNVSRSTIERDEQYAKAVDEITKNTTPEVKQQILSGNSGLTKAEVVEISKAEPEKQMDLVATKPHVANNSGNNEWYTPEQFITAARAVMGSIDLDPASSALANETVKATTYYTAEDDGLSQEWQGNVWMNPPYSTDMIGRFVDKLVDSVEAGSVTQAIVLVNNATETAWFGKIVSMASAVVFPSSRIKYLRPDGAKGSPLQGQAVLYIGRRSDIFLEAFGGCGWGAIIP
jgi:ParB family chromosome partitioning protein